MKTTCWMCDGVGIVYPDPEDIPEGGSIGWSCGICDGTGKTNYEKDKEDETL